LLGTASQVINLPYGENMPQQTQLLNYGKAYKSASFANFPAEAWQNVLGGDMTANKTFAKVPWVYAASDLVASAVMTAPLYFVRGETEWKNGSQDAPPVDWFNDWSIMAYKLVFSALNFGAGYLNNDPADFRYLSPSSITERLSPRTGQLVGFDRVQGRGNSVDLDPEQVVHFWWFKDPLTEVGRANLYPAKIALGSANALHSYQELITKYFESGAVGVKALQSPMPPNPEEAQALKTWWGRVVGGVKNAFGTGVLNPDAKVMKISDNLSEFYDTAVVDNARRDVEAAFGLPETMLNQAANLATKQADQIDFLSNVIEPICDWLATTLNQQAAVALRGYRAVYRLDELQAMQRDENEVSKSVLNYVAAGYGREITADLLGVDLNDEQRAKIQEVDKLAWNNLILQLTDLGGTSRRRDPEEPDLTNLNQDTAVAMRAVELGQLERWVANRLSRGKAVNPEDFNAEHLTPDEVKTVVLRETASAEDTPFSKAASLTPDDEARDKIERRMTAAVYKALRELPQAVIGDNTNGWESRLRGYMPTIRAALENSLRDAVLLGTESGREYVERALGAKKAEIAINWGLVNDAAISWLLNNAEGFGTGYVDYLAQQLGENTADKIRTEIAAWIQNQEPISVLVDKLISDYMFSRSRAEAIAQTEVTRAYAWGNRQAWRESGVVSGMQWVTANDERVCPICAPLGGLRFGDTAEPSDIDDQKRRGVKVDLNAPFVHPGGRGAAGKFKGEEFDLPPAHPRCRCSVVPLI
jgi:hypothetical protein